MVETMRQGANWVPSVEEEQVSAGTFEQWQPR